MPFTFRIFLECVRHCDGPVAEVLAIHSLDGRIRCIKTGKIDEGVPLGVTSVWVTHDFGCLKDYAEGTECIVEQLLVNLWIQITDEDVSSHIQVFVMRRSLIDSNRLAIQFDHVHNFDGIVSILFTKELHKSIALMLASNSVFGHMCVDHRASLQEKFP